MLGPVSTTPTPDSDDTQPVDIMSVPIFPATVVGAVPRLILSAEKEREMYQRKMAKEASETKVLPGGGSGEEASKAIQGDGHHVAESKGEGDGERVTDSKGGEDGNAFTESDDEVDSP